MITQICTDIVVEFVLYLDVVSIARFLSTNKQFWALHLHPALFELVDEFKLLTRKKKWEEGLLAAITKRQYNQTLYFLPKQKLKEPAVQQCMLQASITGDLDLIKILLNNYQPASSTELKTILNNTMYYSVRHGHKDILDFVIQRCL